MKPARGLKVLGADFWDAVPCGGYWDNYRDFMEWVQRTEPYIFRILDRYDWQDKRVIEVGCGQGTTLNYLPGVGASVFGLDMSLESIRSAWAGAIEMGQESRTHISQADVERLPFPEDSFDVALSIGVLHHTENTEAGVQEIYRLLKPDGLAIVMLYRSGNPKWWMTWLLRSSSRLVDRINNRPATLTERLRARKQSDSPGGTALLELFGVPILKAFSNRQVKRMFSDFSEVCITNHQPGFRRLVDVIPALHLLEAFLGWIDSLTYEMWGFYQVVEARK